MAALAYCCWESSMSSNREGYAVKAVLWRAAGNRAALRTEQVGGCRKSAASKIRQDPGHKRGDKSDLQQATASYEE